MNCRGGSGNRYACAQWMPRLQEANRLLHVHVHDDGLDEHRFLDRFDIKLSNLFSWCVNGCYNNSVTIILLPLDYGWIIFADGVQLSLRGARIANNSYVDVEDIGESDNALLCITDKTHCCAPPYSHKRAGEWYFPDGYKVTIEGSNPPENLFFRNRGQGVVRLNRRGNPSERGLFRCQVPDASNTMQSIYINIGMCVTQFLYFILLLVLLFSEYWTSDYLPFWSYY